MNNYSSIIQSFKRYHVSTSKIIKCYGRWSSVINTGVIDTSLCFQVIQVNHSPLVVTFFGTNNANTGLLLDLGESIKPLVSQLSPLVDL